MTRAAAAHASGTNGSQIRSVSAFVNASSEAIAITTVSAIASGARRRTATNQPALNAKPADAAQATGEPTTQNQYGRMRASESP